MQTHIDDIMRRKDPIIARDCKVLVQHNEFSGQRVLASQMCYKTPDEAFAQDHSVVLLNISHDSAIINMTAAPLMAVTHVSNMIEFVDLKSTPYDSMPVVSVDVTRSRVSYLYGVTDVLLNPQGTTMPAHAAISNSASMGQKARVCSTQLSESGELGYPKVNGTELKSVRSPTFDFAAHMATALSFGKRSLIPSLHKSFVLLYSGVLVQVHTYMSE